MWRALYVVQNLTKNVAAPVVLPLMPSRGSLGMDSDPDAVVTTLGRLAPGLRALRAPLQGANVLELGPGRTPELSAAFALSGSARTTAVDTDLQVGAAAGDPARYGPLARRLTSATDFLEAVGATPASVDARLAEGAEPLPLQFKRFDGRHLPVQTSSIDLIVSKSVLEHVRRQHVSDLVSEMVRVLKPTGGMVHVIDVRDHMHIYGDQAVHGDWLDALRYPEWLFNAMFSRRPTSINRLRPPDWRSLLEGAGCSIEFWSEETFPLSEDFDQRRLREPWRSYDPDLLRVGLLTVAARRRGR